jgi:hypothetical protein
MSPAKPRSAAADEPQLPSQAFVEGHEETDGVLSPPSPEAGNAHLPRKAYSKAYSIVLAPVLIGLGVGVPSIFWVKGAFNPATDGNLDRSSKAEPLVQTLPKLLVMSPTPKPMGEAIALGAVVHDLGEGGLAVVRGLPAGTTLSMGTRLSLSDWWLSAADVSAATIQPPPQFVGVMIVTIELRLPDTSVVDRQTLHFRWQEAAAAEAKPSAAAEAKPSAAAEAKPVDEAARSSAPLRHLAPEEVAVALKRAKDLMASGDLGAARLVFQPLAEAGNADAARELAKIYDPMTLEKVQAYGFASDATLAKYWYEKARAYESLQRELQLAGH